MTVESIVQHTIHPRYVTAQARVMDLGANHGRFAQRMIERFGCECVAVEPAPDLFAEIPERTGLRKFNLAIAGSDGEVELQISDRSTANSIFKRSGVHRDAVRVPCRTLDSLFNEVGWDSVDVLKMDIEGAEIEALMACSDDVLRSIGQITVEFHDFIGLSTEEEVNGVIARLEEVGFHGIRMSRKDRKDMWFINRARTGIESSELWRIEHLVRPWNHFLLKTGLKRREKSGRRG